MSKNDPAEPQYFTADDVKAAQEAARSDEKDKLYGRISKTDERFKALDDEVKTLRAAEKKREEDAAKRQAEAEAAKQKAEEAELSAKQLIEKKQAEWDSQMAQFRADQEQREALFAKERAFTQLQIYTRDRVAQEADNIAPELIDYITGNSEEEVEASIEVAKNKTAAILNGIQQAQQAQRAGMPGVAPAGGATAITPGLDTTGDQNLSPEDIAGMDMKSFAALRAKIGMGGQSSSRGIFG